MKPWLRLYRKRSPRFEALPVFARGLFAELLAHTDDEGWIRLGTDDRAALWRYIGAHPKERRTLAKHLDTLVANGSVSERPEGWLIPSWSEHQDDTERARKKHGACTERARKRHGNTAKSPESLNTGPGELDRDREREEEVDSRQATELLTEGARDPGGGPACPPASTASDLPEDGPPQPLRQDTASVLRRAWADAWERQTATPPTRPHLDAVAALAPWFDEYAEATDATPAELVGRAVQAFFAEKARRPGSRPRPEWLAEDPGRYLTTRRAKGRAEPCVIDPERSRQSIEAALELFSIPPKEAANG